MDDTTINSNGYVFVYEPTSHLAKELNVSDKAIEKWCKSENIEKPPRGYWTKK